MSPDQQSDHLHCPKLRKDQLEALNDLVNFGLSFSTNQITIDVYQKYEQEQHDNKSLRSHGLLEHVVSILEYDSTKSFVQMLWTTEIEGLNDKAVALLEIIRYVLTSLHLVFSDTPRLTQNHERAPFIENIVPSLLALSELTGFVEFKW
jgi:hypothetical protein